MEGLKVTVPSFVHFQTRNSSTFPSSTCLNRLQSSYKGRLMQHHPQIHGLLRVMHTQACWATWARISLHKNVHGSKYIIFLVLKAGIRGPYECPRCKTVLRYYPSRQLEERLLLIPCARFKIHCPSYFDQYCVKPRGLHPTHGSVSFNINILSSHHSFQGIHWLCLSYS
jgi:hypothetical protein